MSSEVSVLGTSEASSDSVVLVDSFSVESVDVLDVPLVLVSESQIVSLRSVVLLSSSIVLVVSDGVSP